MAATICHVTSEDPQTVEVTLRVHVSVLDYVTLAASDIVVHEVDGDKHPQVQSAQSLAAGAIGNAIIEAFRDSEQLTVSQVDYLDNWPKP